jgi:hypothetical protein
MKGRNERGMDGCIVGRDEIIETVKSTEEELKD